MLPFIGLLMCVLGVLLFVTLSVAALALGPNVKEGWLPLDAHDTKKIPILLEWDGKSAVIHTGNQLKSIETFMSPDDKNTPELSRFSRRNELKTEDALCAFCSSSIRL